MAWKCHAKEIRPKFDVHAGTKTLRKCADGPDVARRAFSLILDKRTLDVEMDTEARCAEFHGHFEALVAQAKLRRSFAH